MSATDIDQLMAQALTEARVHDPTADPQRLMTLAHHIQSGGTWAQAYGIDQAQLEALYALGHQLYTSARYEAARDVFSQLLNLDHFSRRTYKALAATLQMLGRHEQALAYYGTCAVLDPADPVPPFHAGECLIALGRPTQALAALDAATVQCEGAQHQALAERAAALRQLIHRERASAEGIPNG